MPSISEEIKNTEKCFFIEEAYLSYRGPRPKTVTQAAIISLAKWNVIQREWKEGSTLYTGASETCGLCMRYLKDDYVSVSCGACPVKKLSGKNACENTPFEKYIGANYGTPEEKHAIDMERKFLIELLYPILRKKGWTD